MNEGRTFEMESAAAGKAVRGGFTAEREFGFSLASRFPHLDLSEVDTEGVALVVEIDNPKRLNLFQLSRVLIGAANGGVRTAIVDLSGKGMTAAIPLFNLFALVDENAQLKELRKLEAFIRAGT
ncbi:hypothetical protein ACFWAN_32640 [Streptomyces mirabilis]|uniref:hypothetical protein n=1 Tax=Streptomyces mirabilis TaxID=68239 RepID=UPI0036535293